MKTEIDDEGKMFLCDSCPEKFGNEIHLHKHNRVKHVAKRKVSNKESILYRT